MLSKFKNALYGSSNRSDDNSTVIKSSHYGDRKVLFGERLSALTRSSSFRDDLAGGHSDRNSRASSGGGGVAKERSGMTTTSKDDTHARLSTNSLRQKNGHPDRDSLDSQRYPNRSNGSDTFTDANGKATKSLKFPYSRPEFLQLKTEDEIFVSADHQIRPIILPRDVTRLPWKAGYAECINAGKSIRNEDQASCYQDLAFERPPVGQEASGSTNGNIIPFANQIPWVYFGIFDGHAGASVAVSAAAQLHHIIGEKLNQMANLLIALEFGKSVDGLRDIEDSGDEYKDCEERDGNQSQASKEDSLSDQAATLIKQAATTTNQMQSMPAQIDSENNHLTSCLITSKEDIAQNAEPETPTKDNGSQTSDNANKDPNDAAGRREFFNKVMGSEKVAVDTDSLITGALESAFCEMDSIIAKDKQNYKMPGGCTAIVGLFILGKLYVCNAGDSRAIVYKGGSMIPMSFDFTPTSERERILRLGQQRPELMGTDFTQLEFIRRPTRADIGRQMLYKDAYMTGWAMKTISPDDLKIPLVWGEGKRGRVLATIGVTRGFGDHELRTQYGSVLIKPFLTAEPEVKILPLEEDENLTSEDVLIMGTDGLWDVTRNQEAADIVKNSFELFPDSEESKSKYRYMTAAQDLVIQSRGHTDNSSNIWRTSEDRMASLDDIAVFVIPLKYYRDEYVKWKRLHLESLTKIVFHCNDTLSYLKT